MKETGDDQMSGLVVLLWGCQQQQEVVVLWWCRREMPLL